MTITDEVKSINDEIILIYPNPAGDYIIIETCFYPLVSVQLFNINSEIIFENDLSSSYTQKINTSTLAPGTYFIKVILRDDIITEKIMNK